MEDKPRTIKRVFIDGGLIAFELDVTEVYTDTAHKSKIQKHTLEIKGCEDLVDDGGHIAIGITARDAQAMIQVLESIVFAAQQSKKYAEIQVSNEYWSQADASQEVKDDTGRQ